MPIKHFCFKMTQEASHAELSGEQSFLDMDCVGLAVVFHGLESSLLLILPNSFIY